MLPFFMPCCAVLEQVFTSKHQPLSKRQMLEARLVKEELQLYSSIQLATFTSYIIRERLGVSKVFHNHLVVLHSPIQ
jgi:hypothetical protein